MMEIQVSRNEIQIQNPPFPSPNRALSKSYADPRQHFFFFKPIPASNRRGRVGVAFSPGSLSILRPSFPVPPCVFQAGEGLAPLTIAEGFFVRRLDAILSDLAAGSRKGAKKGTLESPEFPRVTARETKDPGKEQGDRSDVRQEYARLISANRFRARISGWAPALHASAVSRCLSHNLIPSVSPVARRMRPLSVGGVEGDFHPARDHHNGDSDFMQRNCKIFFS